MILPINWEMRLNDADLIFSLQKDGAVNLKPNYFSESAVSLKNYEICFKLHCQISSHSFSFSRQGLPPFDRWLKFMDLSFKIMFNFTPSPNFSLNAFNFLVSARSTPSPLFSPFPPIWHSLFFTIWHFSTPPPPLPRSHS